MRRSGQLVCVLLVFSCSGAVDSSLWAGEPTAEEMMLRAHRARAVWSEFPGFTARITLRADERVFETRVAVTADAEVSFKPELPEEFAWAEGKLRSVVSHRMPSNRVQYNVSFADDETTHPLGRLIKFNEDSLHSLYRIRDDVITEVHRQMEGSRFTISVMDVARNPESKYLPGTYSVAYWATEDDRLRANHTSHSAWRRVGEFDLPHRLLTVKTSAGKRRVQQIDLEGHHLSSPTADK